MAIHSTLTELFAAIADAIRSKTGSSEKIIADNFPSSIRNIPPIYNYTTLDSVRVKPSAKQQVITPGDDCDGFYEVIVEGDYDLVPGNIKKGVSIFGVVGTYEGKEDDSFVVTDDGAGNVTVISAGSASITDDGNGNVAIEYENITDDGNGNVTIV